MRCKFRLDTIERSLHVSSDDGKTYKSEEMQTLVMSPVYSNDPESENRKFWKWSPSGSFKLGTVNVASVAEMKLGGEYYIDITPAQEG